ncbi:MAG TPA: adhesin, partial [Hyalangium sp.]|nr:adhesin [Hyalangium sp.]
MTARWKQLLLGYLLWAGTALAQPDVFSLGTGRDQLLVVTEPRTVINRYTRLTAPVSPGDSEVHVSSTDGFAAGDLVMVLQTAALRPGPWPTSGPLLTLGEDSVGQWELARLSSAQGQQLKLTEPLQRRFAAVGAQVVRIPEYTDVQVWAGASLVAAPWDGSTGGVLAFLARGTLHNEGALEASGAGFRGGRAVPGAQGSPGCVALPLAARPGGGRGKGLSSQEGEAMVAGSERVDNGG